MSTVKFYIGKIEERNGEYEYTHVIRFRLGSRRKPGVHLEAVCKDWYGTKPERSDGGYYFNCGEVFVRAYSLHGISKETYLALDGIITSM